MDQWQSGLLPYPVLLLAQVLVLSVMFWICADFSRGQGMFVQPYPGRGNCVAVVQLHLFRRYGASLRDLDVAATRSTLVRRHHSHHLPLRRRGVSPYVRDVSRQAG